MSTPYGYPSPYGNYAQQGGYGYSMQGGMQGGMHGGMHGGMQGAMQGSGMMPVNMNAGGMPPNVPSGAVVTPSGGNIVTAPLVEESYVENILRLNRGKIATVYMTYENNREWNAKVFKGVILAAGRDHIILSDPVTGMRFLLLTLNLDYITFDEPINYEYPFHGTVVTDSTPMQTDMTTTGTAAGSR